MVELSQHDCNFATLQSVFSVYGMQIAHSSKHLAGMIQRHDAVGRALSVL